MDILPVAEIPAIGKSYSQLPALLLGAVTLPT